MNKSLEAADNPILLTTAAQLSEAEMSWKGNEVLGIDTEFVRERTYRADLGLVQLSDGATAWLVDTVKLEDLEPLRKLLVDPGVTKVLHSGSEDLEVLLNSVGDTPAPLFDTQVACAMLGQPLQMGYHGTAQWLFGIEVDKEQTRSNWCKRPLTDRQLHYAAMDVVLLPEIYRTLKARLEEKGRMGWLQEEMERAARNARQAVEPEQAYLRISGAGRLDGHGLRSLRALASWREKLARERNLARGFVVPDAGLLNLAREKPASVKAARKVEGIHPKVLERNAREFVELINSAVADDGPVYYPGPLDNRQRKKVAAMREIVKKTATELVVEPALLASKRELERLLRAVEGGKDVPERFTGWRQAVITDDLIPLIR